MKSIVTKYMDISILSGKPMECMHHLIFGNGLREKSDKYGLIVPLTNDEHNMSLESIHLSRYGSHLSKIIGQLAWEKQYYKEIVMLHAQEQGTPMGEDDDPARILFRKEFGQSYL